MKITAIFLLIILCIATVANGAEEHAIAFDAHQRKTIAYQFVNIIILFSGLIYFLKDTIKQLFKDRRALFLSASEKAQEARSIAERDKSEIQIKLTKLEVTAEESILRARAEAGDMKKQLIEEAKELSKRIQEEASTAARLEIEKAKDQLRVQMINEALGIARQEMTSVSTDDLKRLQTDFIENIEAATR